MADQLYTAQEAADVYRAWAAGRCPCCSTATLDNDKDANPVAIGDGVTICGWCAYREHDAGDVAPILLTMITQGRTNATEETNPHA